MTPPLIIFLPEKIPTAEHDDLVDKIRGLVQTGGVLTIDPDVEILQLVDGRWRSLRKEPAR